MKAIREVGVTRVVRYVWVSLLLSLLRRTWISPGRVLFLRICGATVGAGTVIHRITLINVDRGGFRALKIGANCFVGDEVLFDLAAPVVLEDHVTLATRTTVLTHLNVGYADHPLRAQFPPRTEGVTIRRGSFVGAMATILCGVTVGPEAFVAAASLVNRTVTSGERVGGVPIRTLP
jgi:UDP-2-acetamido-3-amino-2,3-dideoxy-glucuronate N-acetyltransferase